MFDPTVLSLNVAQPSPHHERFHESDHQREISTHLPHLFVVGCPRSGTTLLQRMLDNHPDLTVTNDTHFIPKVIARHPGGSNPALTSSLVNDVREYKRFHRMHLTDEAVNVAAARSSTYRDFVSNLYQQRAISKGKRLAGEKTPDYVRCLPLLHGLFSWAKFIHIIRDGRDVALSVLEWATSDKGPGRLALWKDEPIAVCAMWWRWNVMLGRRDGKSLESGLYHELRYEELVEEPEAVLRTLCLNSGLSFSNDMLRFYEGRVRYRPELSAKDAWLPPTSGVRNWRTEMSSRDQQLFQALAGDALEMAGYAPACAWISSEVVARAAQCRVWWMKEKANQQPWPVPISITSSPTRHLNQR